MQDFSVVLLICTCKCYIVYCTHRVGFHFSNFPVVLFCLCFFLHFIWLLSSLLSYKLKLKIAKLVFDILVCVDEGGGGGLHIVLVWSMLY